MLIGYVRVSTNDQNTELQRNALECAGCELIFEDKISGTKSDRPGLKKLLRTLSEGDTLVVWKLDRLGRSMRHLVILVEELRERGVNFRSLTDAIDTSTPMGRFFFHVMGALAEMERELIVERTRAGLEAARAKGRIGGRRPKLTASEWEGTVAKLAMRQPFVLFKGLTFQKLCLPGAFRPGDHHNKMLRPGLCVVHASPQYL